MNANRGILILGAIALLSIVGLVAVSAFGQFTSGAQPQVPAGEQTTPVGEQTVLQAGEPLPPPSAVVAANVANRSETTGLLGQVVVALAVVALAAIGGIAGILRRSA